MIHFSKCKIPYPHDFEDYPCKKCNAFLMITGSGLMVKGKTINKRMIILSLVVMVKFLGFYVGKSS